MSETLPTTYFSALHDEAYSLLVEARDYIAALRLQGNGDTKKNADYLDVTIETMRLTTRLTQVMAWILAQKAVQNDELSPVEGTSKRYRLSGHSVCMDTNPGQSALLPPYLRDLLTRSFELYCRVDRIENQIRDRMGSVMDRESLPLHEGPYPRPVSPSDQSPRTAY
jgi:regulator of CtrA degradation